MMLSKLQLISFEVTDQCNLACVHDFCPASKIKRKGNPASDDSFLSFVSYCVFNGFNGNIAFHYYNEPTLYLTRCKALHEAINALGLSTTLWTNGTHSGDLSAFDNVYATRYPESRHCGSKSIEYRPDDRLKIYEADECQEYRPCYRPETIEMPIDYCGNVHMCCGDWAGQISIGNIGTDYFDIIRDKWASVMAGAKDGLYNVCHRCQGLAKSPALYTHDFIV